MSHSLSHFINLTANIMEISDDLVQEMKDMAKKAGKEEPSDIEAREIAGRLVGLVELLFDHGMEEARKKQRLKKEPGGFPVEGSYSCLICHNGINPTTGWYDRWGPKCLVCQKALNEGVVPTFICEHHDSYYSMWHLKDRFGIKHQTAKKLIREGKLKARMILCDDGTVHEYVFLKKENPELIDPERPSPAWKSYQRHRNKEIDKSMRKHKEEWREERKKREAKWRKIKRETHDSIR